MNLEEKLINYHLLSKAILEYIKKGYEQIEVPWIVTAEASMSTAPAINQVYHTSDVLNEHFVGSAEQGFIQLLLDKNPKILPNKYYFSVSPCFRRDIPNEIYSRWFMKLELFCLLPENYEQQLLYDAHKVHKKLFKVDLDVIPTDIGIDLSFNGIEIGSYGIRKLTDNKNIQYAYGTGIALPRAQLILDNYKN